MKTLIEKMTEQVTCAFEKAGLPMDHIIIQQSDRPDLADFQCNSAFQLAKSQKKNPREIALKVVENLSHDLFRKIEVAGPGFINLTLKKQALEPLLDFIKHDAKMGCKIPQVKKNIVVDYGGPNVAKALHVGHLRPAIIGEAIKRIIKFAGHNVIGDVHLGDWGTPMGMLIAALEEQHPDWPYFDQSQTKNFPTESPIQVGRLNSLYPESAARFKTDEVFAEKARKATAELQDGRAGYRALHRHFCNLSIQSMQEDYKRLNVEFDLWLGESDVHDLVPAMLKDLRQKNLLIKSDGAEIVHVAKNDDKEDIPPCILVKRDGGYNYSTTDLATILDRVERYKADHILYVVDTRQSLHFKQFFRVSEMAGYLSQEHLTYANFGTLNGPNGKPFKTRDGGVMTLSHLIDLAEQAVLKQTGFHSKEDLDFQQKRMIEQIAIAAIKFGDLANHRQSDYIFDIQAFVQTEGKTGPYIQYAAVRIKSILEKLKDRSLEKVFKIEHDAEKELALLLLKFPQAVEKSIEAALPNIMCEHIYLLAKAFNRFYKHCPVAGAADQNTRDSRANLCELTLKQIEIIMQDMLAIDIPDRMLRQEDKA